MSRKKEVRNDIEIEVIEGRDMTDQEIATVAHILFEWWRREFESKHVPEESKNELS
jgi:hypothetical protein